MYISQVDAEEERTGLAGCEGYVKVKGISDLNVYEREGSRGYAPVIEVSVDYIGNRWTVGGM